MTSIRDNKNRLLKLNPSICKILNERFPQYNRQLCFNESKIDMKTILKYNNNNYFSIKPYGKRAFLWFTYIDNRFCSIIKFYDSNNRNSQNIKNNTNTNTVEYYEYSDNFDNTLSYNNVLLYGYYTTFETNNYFIIDTVLNYNDYNYIINTNKYHTNFLTRLKLLKLVLDKYKCYNNLDKQSIYLPFICTTLDDAFNNIYNLNYRPFGITIWNDSKNIGTYLLNNRTDIINKNINGIFKVVAGLNDDQYYLYCANNNNNNNSEYIFHNSALINTYRLSVYMNNIFRKIRENRDLDLIEESEDEEDFENIDENKFVDLDKSVYMLCSYNRKFQKWIPKYTINNNLSTNKSSNNQSTNIITKRELYFIEKK